MVVEVSATTLRAMFDADQIDDRAKRGELSIEILKSNDARPGLGMPAGTKSQLIAYKDPSGAHIATAHRYLRPDGTLGASGLPDPKSLVRGGVLYRPWWS